MVIYNIFPLIIIYLSTFITNNLCLTKCDIYLNSVQKCIVVYNISWTVPFDKKVSVNLCREQHKHCEEWIDPDIDGYPISIQPDGRNYTINVGFHCNFERNAVFNKSENTVFLKVPSTNCAKKYCLFDITDNSQNNLRINLTSIRSLSSQVDGIQYYFQICKINVPNICGNSPISCKMDQKNVTTSLGDNNWAVFYYGVEKGLQLILHAPKKVKMIIQINCDQNVLHSFSFLRKQGKHYFFNLVSNELCLRLPIKYNTRVQNERNFVYDISELQGRNWEVPLPDRTVIIFTIGDSIQDDKYLNFGDRNIFACRNTTNKCISLGSVTTGLTVNENNSQILYTNGDMCQNGELASLRIQFLCFNKQNQPQILNIDKNCSYDIIWKTSFGCPHAIGVPGDCTVYDNVASLYPYNFTSLKNRNVDYGLELSNGYLRINLCDQLNSSCGQTVNTSLCLETTDGLAIPFGPVNKTPIFKDGKIEFLYSNDQNGTSNLKYTVRLHMVCNLNETRNNSLIVAKEMNQNNNYEINLEWRTNLACYRPHDQIKCNVQGDANINLHKLIRTEVNYEIPYKNSVFILNVCKPVIFNENAFYSGQNPGVIMVDNTNANLQTKVTNLGNVVNEPSYDLNSKTIKMEYTIKNSFPERKSILYFYCNRNYKVPDIQVKINTNIYNFLIFTNETCMENDEDVDLNSILNNLNDSIADHVIEVPPKADEISAHKINCSIVSEMNNYTIKTLLMNYSYNETQQLTFDIENDSKVENIFKNLRNYCNKLILNTTQHLGFNNVHEFNIKQQDMNIELKLYCNYTTGIGNPKLRESVNYDYIYYWYSTIFCPKSKAIYIPSTLILKNPILFRELDFRQLLGLDSSKEIIKVKTSKTESTVNFRAAKYNSIMNYQENVVEFNVYQSNDACLNQNSTTRFNLICDLEKTTFQVKQETNCLTEFDWYVRDACYFLGLESTLIHAKNLPIFDTDNNVKINSASSSISIILKICIAIFLILLFPLCFYIYKKRYHLIFTRTANGGYVQVRWENESTL